MDKTTQYDLTSDEKSVLFFRRVKKELGITSSRRIVAVVGRVLGHVKAGLSPDQTKNLLRQMPDMFQMLMLSNWSSTSAAGRYQHLDELVDEVYEEDKKSGHSLFVSEVEAMNTVVVILTRLDKYINLFSFEALNGSCVHELKQIPMEDAA